MQVPGPCAVHTQAGATAPGAEAVVLGGRFLLSVGVTVSRGSGFSGDHHSAGTSATTLCGACSDPTGLERRNVPGTQPPASADTAGCAAGGGHERA